MVQLSCPDSARWQALLSDSAPDAPELESHLGACPRCRELLDDLAVGSSGWLRDASRLATDTDRDPEMTRTLHRLREVMAEDHAGPPIPLDFLTPSDQPGLLGTLGRYQVLEVIGRGAMGIVLKALDPDLLRPVAVKVLAPYLAPSGTARERFKREARAAAAVSHDHVVTIHAVEEANGLPFFVMEYVTGMSLQGRIDRDGPLPPRDIARIGMQAANGLAAAHEQGLVHRDIKPANILLENGVERVKLTDFGLARAADDARLTQSGVAAGTPLYMSPEHAIGSATTQSDLFSLGSVLYTLATGFPPFRAGSAMGVLHRIINDPPRRIRETSPDFPTALETIIMQLLEKNPARRFQSAAELANRLTEFLAAAPEPPRPRRGWLAPAALALAAALLIAGVVLTFRTPYGTLTVEVNDPAVKVALDGDALTITGAGAQEVRYKTGTYRVTAHKDGKPVKVSQEVVTITRDGKPVVTVTVEPASGLPPAVAASSLPSPVPVAPAALDTEKVLEERIKDALPDANAEQVELMRQAWRAHVFGGQPTPVIGGVPVPQLHTSFRMLGEMMVRAAADPAKASKHLRDAYGLAGTMIQNATATRKTAGAPKDVAKIDPTWAAKLDPLKEHFNSFQTRLAGTPAGGVAAVPGPVDDPDKATAGLTEPTRGRVKRLLSLRDQFGVLYPKAQQAAIRLPLLRTMVAHNLRESVERDLEASYATLKGLLADMDTVAAELGALPYQPARTGPPAASKSEWEKRLKKQMDEVSALGERLAKTPAGRVLLTAGPGADPDKATAGMDREDAFQARRVLVLRDQFRLLGEQPYKELDRWEKARAARDNAKTKYDAGLISENDFNLFQLDLTQADRALRAIEEGMARVAADLKKLADELEDPSRTGPEAEYKKVMAEYDALALRLAKHRIGRVVVTFVRNWNASHLNARTDLNEADRAVAARLLNVRDELLSQKERGDIVLRMVKQWRDQLEAKKGDPTAVAEAEQGIREQRTSLKVVTETARGIVADLKQLADEIHPPAKAETPEADFKKIMAEYDALTERVVKTPVGRLLATIKPGFGWGDAELQLTFPSDKAKQDLGRRLLTLRGQIVTQSGDVNKAVNELPQYRTGLERAQAEKSPAETAVALEDAIRSRERVIRFGTEAIRGMVADLNKLADEIDPAGKPPAPEEDPRFQKLRVLKEQIERAEGLQATIEDLSTQLISEEKKLKDLEKQRTLTADAKANADLDKRIVEARKHVAHIKDEIAEYRSRLGRQPAVADLRKELDRLRKEIADSQTPKAPEPAKGPKK